MPQSAIAADVHQHLDVLADFAAQVTLDLVLALDDLAKLDHLGLTQMIGLRRSIDRRLLTDLPCSRAPHTKDVGQ